MSTSIKPSEALPTHNKSSEVVRTHQFGANAFDKLKNVDNVEVMDVEDSDDASSTVESVSKKRKSSTRPDKYSNLNSSFSKL